MTRKITSITLVLLLILSLCTLSFGTVSAEASDLPEVAEGCNRYFFLMPEEWYNEYSDSAGIYWWEGTNACSSWPGYKAHKADAENVYYYDVPRDVETIIWNNFVDGGADKTADIYYNAIQTVNIGTVCYDKEENEYYPDGVSSFDGMIFVVDPDKTSTSVMAGKLTWEGDWFYYYGNGEYGTEEPLADFEDLPEVEIGCYRYFFLMPEEWYNEYSDSAGIYWWEGTDACSSWPGYKAHKADAENVYYYDVPKDVNRIMWNNYVDLTLEEYNDANWADLSTGHKELEDIPVDLSECDGKIHIINPEKTVTNPFSGKKIYYGDWLFYYGNGQYGTTEVPAVSDSLPEVAEGCNRYFFLLPDFWCNEYADSAGIYWWEGTDVPDAWPGYKAHKADAENIYYYDVPKDVQTIIWNNYIDGGVDKTADIYKAAIQTKNITASYYEPGESDTYPDGLESFDGMIFVIDPRDFPYGPFSGKLTFSGEWYYYYGNDRYGTTPERETPANSIVGDADYNGLVTISDATAIQKYIVGITVDGFSSLCADVNSDGDVNIKDATDIQKYIAIIEVDSPIGELITE